ncbi:MAG: hypothetical protein HQK66_09005, partial [Desulfamplus sp.]|nr:hypothetical protein [Desulfamplus sp.]
HDNAESYVDSKIEDNINTPGAGSVRQKVSQGDIDFGNYSWDQIEKLYIDFVLKKNNWNVTWAAKYAGVNRSTFASRMRKVGIKRSNLG